MIAFGSYGFPKNFDPLFISPVNPHSVEDTHLDQPSTLVWRGQGCVCVVMTVCLRRPGSFMWLIDAIMDGRFVIKNFTCVLRPTVRQAWQHSSVLRTGQVSFIIGVVTTSKNRPLSCVFHSSKSLFKNYSSIATRLLKNNTLWGSTKKNGLSMANIYILPCERQFMDDS